MFKCIHGLAPHYLSNDVTMHFDIHGYDTKNAENMDLYIPRCTKEIYKRSFSYKGSSLWNKLPPYVKESTSLIDFKHNYRLLNGWIHIKVIVPFIGTHILYHILMLLFYQFCLQLVRSSHILGAISIRKTVLPGMAIPMLKIRRPTGRLIFNMGIPIPGKTVFYIETYLNLIMLLLLLCMISIYGCVYMCSLYLYILLCNRAPRKNRVTEWFTLYKYIWNKNKLKKIKYCIFR